MFSFSYFLLVNLDPTKGFIEADSKSTLPHFFKNHHELLTLIQSCHAILTFLVNRGLLAVRRRCSCGILKNPIVALALHDLPVVD